jgi:hypothetical protein
MSTYLVQRAMHGSHIRSTHPHVEIVTMPFDWFLAFNIEPTHEKGASTVYIHFYHPRIYL